MGADEFVDDVRFWVGCAGPVAPIVCAAWNTGMLDTGATHLAAIFLRRPAQLLPL